MGTVGGSEGGWDEWVGGCLVKAKGGIERESEKGERGCEFALEVWVGRRKRTRVVPRKRISARRVRKRRGRRKPRPKNLAEELVTLSQQNPGIRD